MDTLGIADSVRTLKKVASIRRAQFSIGLLLVCITAGPTRAQENDEALAFVEVHFSEDFDNLFDRPRRPVVSPDGRDLYLAVAQRNEMEHYGDVAHFLRDEDDGTLLFSEITPADFEGLPPGESVTEIALSPNGEFFYLAHVVDFGEQSQPRIGLFTRDANTGVLTPAESLAFDDGLLLGIRFIISVAVAPDGQYLYAMAHNNTANRESLLTFAIDSESGVLTAIDRDDRLPSDFQARPGQFSSIGHIVVSPDGRNVYAAGEIQGGVEVYTVDQKSGQVAFVRLATAFSVGGSLVSEIAVAPDGGYVYATESWAEGYEFLNPTKLIAYARDPITGDLTLPVWGSTDIVAIPGLGDFVIAPDGQRIYAQAGPFVVFARDTDTGALSLIDLIEEPLFLALLGRSSLSVSPDSETMYASTPVRDALSVFAVEPSANHRLPCADFPGIVDEYEALAAAYSLAPDIDLDGLPEAASLALIQEAACAPGGNSLTSPVEQAYLINMVNVNWETESDEPGGWQPYLHALATLRMISETMEPALNEAMAAFDQEMEPWGYVFITCVDGVCGTEAARNVNEPFSGEGDPDDDGATNAEEWANVLARGGDVNDFTLAALDPANDGTIIISSSSTSGSCFIATAAYGTPLAAELDTLRAFRDQRLLTNPLGAAFADAYYRLSPPAAALIAEQSVLRGAVKFGLGFLLNSGSEKMGVGLLLLLAATALCRRNRQPRSGRP